MTKAPSCWDLDSVGCTTLPFSAWLYVHMFKSNQLLTKLCFQLCCIWFVWRHFSYGKFCQGDTAGSMSPAIKLTNLPKHQLVIFHNLLVSFHFGRDVCTQLEKNKYNQLNNITFVRYNVTSNRRTTIWHKIEDILLQSTAWAGKYFEVLHFCNPV